MTDEILEILQKDARRTPDEIAAMLGKKPAAVSARSGGSNRRV